MENLFAARKCLADGLNRSRSLSNNNQSTTSPCSLQKSTMLPSLVDELHYHHDRCQMLAAIQTYSEQAMGPASAVLKVYGAVQALEQTLTTVDPCTDLFGYISFTKRLEEALRLLADNCQLAVRWLDDVVTLLDDEQEVDDIYVLNVKKSLRVLKELKVMDARSRLGGGGALFLAFGKLEIELGRMLKQERPISDNDDDDDDDDDDNEKRIHTILERLEANGLLKKCFTVYIDTRSSVAKSRLRRSVLDLDDYLEMEISGLSDSVQRSIIIEEQIIRWGNDMEIAVKEVIQYEFDLSKRVFFFSNEEEKIRSSAGCSSSSSTRSMMMSCFSEIVAQSGFLDLLQFGNKVTETKKDAIKLLKLLHVFATLDRLRLDFNTLFGGNECIEIQNLTRDIIKRVVDGAYQIFKELAHQIVIQRYNAASPPPFDAGVPRLVSFVTDYCILLLDDEYMPVLSKVISIHHIWSNSYSSSINPDIFLRNELHKIIETVETNLEKYWSKNFEEPTLGYLFLMNNYLYLYEKFRGTEFGDLIMGGEQRWLGELQKKMLFYADLYLKESWGKLAAILSEEGLLLFSPGRVAAKELVKKRLREFNEMFDILYRKQSRWIISSDDSIRETICELIAQTVVPVYRRYLHNYGYLVENSRGGSGTHNSPNKYVKYSATSLEALISSLYRPNPVVVEPVRFSRSRSVHLMGRIKSAVSTQLRATPITI